MRIQPSVGRRGRCVAPLLLFTLRSGFPAICRNEHSVHQQSCVLTTNGEMVNMFIFRSRVENIHQHRHHRHHHQHPVVVPRTPRPLVLCKFAPDVTRRSTDKW
ncbi:unnamed protein product, partial [Ectocarpus sp. 6 AP-2014]